VPNSCSHEQGMCVHYTPIVKSRSGQPCAWSKIHRNLGFNTAIPGCARVSSSTRDRRSFGAPSSTTGSTNAVPPQRGRARRSSSSTTQRLHRRLGLKPHSPQPQAVTDYENRAICLFTQTSRSRSPFAFRCFCANPEPVSRHRIIAWVRSPHAGHRLGSFCQSVFRYYVGTTARVRRRRYRSMNANLTNPR
jgi:hypothetical protein